jgi:hypothetical protein
MSFLCSDDYIRLSFADWCKGVNNQKSAKHSNIGILCNQLPVFCLIQKAGSLPFPTSKMSQRSWRMRHPLRDLITDRAERAAAGHAEPFLQCSKAP